VTRLRAAIIVLILSAATAAAAQQNSSALPDPTVDLPVPGSTKPATTTQGTGTVQQATQSQKTRPKTQSQGTQGQGTQGQGSQGQGTQGGVGDALGNPLGGTPLGGLGPVDTSSSTGPMEIDADDGIEWRRDEKVYIARGHAKATRGDMSVSADSLIAHYRDTGGGNSSSTDPDQSKTAIYMVEALGNVVVLSKDSKIVGDRAVYDLDKGSAVITGSDLKATSKDSVVTARDSLEYWTKLGAVVARGNAVAADKTHHVKADMLVGYFHTDDKGQKKMYQVEATGNVLLDNNGNVALAHKAIYNMDSDIATLDGGVKITRGKNQLNGEHAVYNTKTGQAKVTGGRGQVKTLLIPGSDSGTKDLGGALKP
jgi:lipopolysaccharide export system protein LptA